MAEMIFLQCDNGSRVAQMACPICGHISLQVLKRPYAEAPCNELDQERTCPVCASVYDACSAAQSDAWAEAFARYQADSSAYNRAVKTDYDRQCVTEVLSAQVLPLEDSFASDSEYSKPRNIELLPVPTPETSPESADGSPEQGEHTPADAETGEPTSLEKKLIRWKKELLDTGKRNRMINYRETTRSTLKILEPDLETLFNQLAISEKELTFQRPISKDSDYRTYAMLTLLETLSYTLPVHVGDIKAEGTTAEREKTLKNLRAKNKLAREEQGANILYLSFGFILWRESDKPNSKWMKAPLLMMPVSLEVKSLNAPYTIKRYDDEIEVNPTLDYLLHAEYGIELPAFELKNKKSITDYLNEIESVIDCRGWKLVREVGLALLSFRKINMYHDLNKESNLRRIMQHPVLRAMGGEYTAVKGIPPELQNFDLDQLDPKECYQVVNADSSQQDAILLSKNGISFVMQGPPGTGKSQTITNIIAEAMADGKKILFVSEKAAALQVVLKRLTEVGLSDFCLSLHDYRANKKAIIDNIGANLSLPAQEVSRRAMRDLTELFRNREQLNQYAQALHQRIAPLDVSIYSAYGKITQVTGETAVEFMLEDPISVTKEQFEEMGYQVEMLERVLHTMGCQLHENPWYKTTATSSGQAFRTQLSKQTPHLVENSAAAEAIVANLTAVYGLPVEGSWQGAQEAVTQVRATMELPLFPYAWTEEGKLDTLLNAAKEAQQTQKDYYAKRDAFRTQYLAEAQNAATHSAHLNEQLELISAAWTDQALELDAETIYSKLDECYAKLCAGTEDPDHPMEACIEDAVAAAHQVLDSVQNLLSYHSHANELLKMGQPDSIQGMRKLSRTISILMDTPDLERDWFDPRKNAEIMPILEEAWNHSISIQKRTTKLLRHWEPAVLSVDAEGMLARFKTAYTGVLHKLKATYREDIRTLKLLAKEVGAQITEASAIELLQAIKELNEEKAWFEQNHDQIAKVCQQQPGGVETDWKTVKYGVTSALTIAGMFPHFNLPEETVEALLSALHDSQKAAELRQLHDELSEQAIAALEQMIQERNDIQGWAEDASISATVIPQIQQFCSDCAEQKQFLASIRSCQKEDETALTYQNITTLLDQIVAVRTERAWFEAHNQELSDLFGSHYQGEQTDWELIDTTMPIQDAVSVKQWNEDLEAQAKSLAALFQDRYTGVDTDWAALVHDMEQVDAFLRSRAPAPAFVETICSDVEKRQTLGAEADQLDALIGETAPEVDAFLALFEHGETLKAGTIHAIAEQFSVCMERFDLLDQWIDYVETKRECDQLGLGAFTQTIEQADHTVSDVRGAFETGFYLQWIPMALEQIPSVQKFRRRVHDQHLEKFAELDEAQFSIARDRIRSKIIRTFPDPDSLSGPRSEIGILKHEMEKKRRIMPLRKLFHIIPNLLLTLKPCLMMSPLSVAYFLEADDYHFDMVIFDEASQIFPQDAIGAIFRADQVIIAGDTKQLPPTNFFTANTGNGADDFDMEEEDEWEEEIYDSILEETSNILPNRTLLWHYRSKSEQLIAFSNQTIYQNKLITFPNTNEREADSGVEFVYVKEGYYEGGGRNCNLLEAKRCVELVKEHIQRHPDRSLGIIAFSEKQQQVIQREIQLFREQNPAYEEFFQEGKEEEFFIKNLENVQGDERDTILFSVGYAKTKEQKAKGEPMAMRFGPLGVQGGERRLNVAITRAKRNVKLVSSILPSDIDLTRTVSEGIHMLHDYLAFAMNGGEALPNAEKKTAPDEFKAAVAAYLRDSGYEVRESVGYSEYKIDIAIQHPKQPEKLVVGIECDGMSYRSARTARDRDRLRKSVLTAMGWKLYRIWSTEWYRNPDLEGKKLLAFIDAAIAEETEKSDPDGALKQPGTEEPLPKQEEDPEIEDSAEKLRS